jgi:hypothetical protein
VFPGSSVAGFVQHQCVSIQKAVFVLAMVSTGSASAQADLPDFSRHSVSGAFLYGIKTGPNNTALGSGATDTPGYGIDYVFRPVRWLGLEAGFEQVIHPIGASVCCEYQQNADDNLFLVPFGLRYVWEPRNSRVRLTIGGGGAYLKYTIGNPGGGVGFAGLTEFSAWGGQAVATGDYAITRSGRLRAGLLLRYYFASPKPSEIFGPPGYNPSESLHLLTVGPQVTFSFR